MSHSITSDQNHYQDHGPIFSVGASGSQNEPYGTVNTHSTRSHHTNSSSGGNTGSLGASGNRGMLAGQAHTASMHSLAAAASSHSIRAEIGRFEGVHPKIFEVYDTLEKLERKLSSDFME